MKNNKAFTLIELIVVMAIIAILVLLAAPRFLGYTKNANVTAMEQDVKVLADASEVYHIENEDWPIVNGSQPVNIGAGGLIRAYPIDSEKVDSSIKNIKGEYDDYGVIIDGESVGKVVKLEGITNDDGVISYGSKTYENSPSYTPNVIDRLIEVEGYIPVSTSDDLQAVGTGEHRTWGAGTKWERNVDSDGELITGKLVDKYIQVADIDLSGVDDFEPIGTGIGDFPLAFKGTYDGGGFIVSGLNINSSTKNYAGLFGSAKDAILTNVHIVDGEISAQKYVGGLVGVMHNTSVSKSSFSGNIIGHQGIVGGLIGWSGDGSVISNSHSKGTVQGGNIIGGFIGENGFMGGGPLPRYRDSIIINSHTESVVKGVVQVGGFIGLNRPYSVIEESYYNAEHSALDSAIGDNHKDTHRIKGLTNTEMRQANTYKNWNTNIWNIKEGSLPELKR